MGNMRSNFRSLLSLCTLLTRLLDFLGAFEPRALVWSWFIPSRTVGRGMPLQLLIQAPAPSMGCVSLGGIATSED